MKSGFGGFQNLSSTSAGKKTIADSFGTLDAAIRSILGDPNAIIYTTAVPSTIFTDNIGVHRWSALNYNSDLFLSQSTNTSKMALSDTYKLGKYSSVYCAGGTQNMRYFNTPEIYTKKRNTFVYFGWVEFPTTVVEAFVFRNFNAIAPLGWGTSGYTSYISDEVRLGYTINIAVTGTLNRFIRTTYTASINAPIVLGQIGSNVFRLTEEIYDSTNRTFTSSYYDQNKSLITPTNLAGANANAQWLASSNNFSIVVSQTSVSASTAGWDKNFPNSSFPPLTGGIGTATANTGKLAYHTIIQSLSNTIYDSNTVKNLKNLLDKVYGV